MMGNTAKGATPPDASSPGNGVDFDRATLPWLDKPFADLLVRERLANGTLTDESAQLLLRWHNEGYMVLDRIVPESQVRALLDDYDRVWQEKPVCKVQLGAATHSYVRDLPPRAEISERYRTLDLHNISEAAREIALNPTVVYLVSEILQDQPTVIQSLFFEYGSEQPLHQDFVFVPSGVPSRLVGAWFALEDVGPEQGPLSYVPGSQRIKKFGFDGGLTFNGSGTDADRWQQHIAAELERLNLSVNYFYAKRSDCLLWHSALVHGGSPVTAPRRTRLSFVVHYAARGTYPEDYRTPGTVPLVIEKNGGAIYSWQEPGHIEGRYALPKR